MLYKIETTRESYEVLVDTLTLPRDGGILRSPLTQALIVPNLKRKVINRVYLEFDDKWIPITSLQLDDGLVKAKVIRNSRERVYK